MNSSDADKRLFPIKQLILGRRPSRSMPCKSTVTAQETDEETQHCIYCGAARREQGAVRCEACGIHN